MGHQLDNFISYAWYEHLDSGDTSPVTATWTSRVIAPDAQAAAEERPSARHRRRLAAVCVPA